MVTKLNQLLSSPLVDKLAIIVGEATRAASNASDRFIEPARGTLDRSISKRHHLIFGRRGSGKTSLLKKAQADFIKHKKPCAFIELETFKGHAYPDVLLSVLIQTLKELSKWLLTVENDVQNATKGGSWLSNIWSKHSPKNRKRHKHARIIRQNVETQIKSLTELLNAEDGAALSKRETSQKRSSVQQEVQTGVGLSANDAKFSGNMSSARGREESIGIEQTENNVRDKNQFLLRHIIEYQELFDQIVDFYDADLYIFLDDLYHIRRRDQAYVLDYFHRIIKGRRMWLKVGTIRHRTEWYHHGSQPIGLKIGDDCDVIDLDITLEKYELAKTFLLQVLNQLIEESGLQKHTNFITEGAADRLVLASGGVARDFLTIFRRSIDLARERGATYRGEKINAEDINAAAGEHEPAKRDELKRDTDEERSMLEFALQKIQEFCIANKSNCFLIEHSISNDSFDILGELADLRFVHIVAQRTSVRDDPGRLYTGYMLDVSQYTGARARREMDFIDFWKPEGLDKIRRSKYVLDVKTLSSPS